MIRAEVKQTPGGRYFARLTWSSNGREIAPETTAYKREADLVRLLEKLIGEFDMEIVGSDGSKTHVEG